MTNEIKRKPLLSTNNSKTVKGEKLGYMTYILYMSPFKANSKGKNEWMLLAKEGVAVREGGKPYIECLGCGNTTHL